MDSQVAGRYRLQESPGSREWTSLRHVVMGTHVCLFPQSPGASGGHRQHPPGRRGLDAWPPQAVSRSGTESSRTLAHPVTTGRAHVGTSPTADPLPPPPKVTPGPWPHAIMVFVTTQGPETDGPGLGQL